MYSPKIRNTFEWRFVVCDLNESRKDIEALYTAIH